MKQFTYTAYAAEGASGRYTYRRLEGPTTFETAKALYEKIGNHTFVAAEPFDDFAAAFGRKRVEEGYGPSSAWISERIKVLQVLPSPSEAKPRKPPPAIPPEVWRKAPEQDTIDYMAAVRAMCGRRSE